VENQEGKMKGRMSEADHHPDLKAERQREREREGE
jgi:hypothetical protein